MVGYFFCFILLFKVSYKIRFMRLRNGFYLMKRLKLGCKVVGWRIIMVIFVNKISF